MAGSCAPMSMRRPASQSCQRRSRAGCGDPRLSRRRAAHRDEKAPPRADQRYPARGRQARRCPQDHRPAADRGQADHSAHLSDRRCPARCAAETARRAQRGARTARHQAQRQRHDHQGAGAGAAPGAQVQRLVRRRQSHQLQPRRYLGRGGGALGPDHADHRRGGCQADVGDRHRNEGARRKGPRRQIAAA